MWSVPRYWPGRTVAVLASGASMSQAVADRVRHLPCIAVNRTWELVPWADIIYGADAAWWESAPKAIRAQGLKVSIDVVGIARRPGLLYLRQSWAPRPADPAQPHDKWGGFDPDPGALRSGGNSGYQALTIAVHTGAAHILLCGFDMGGAHWHGAHNAGGLRETTPDAYALFRTRFDGLAPILADRGVDVINCSADTALTCFRRLPLEIALAETAKRAAA